MARPPRNNVDYFPFYCQEDRTRVVLEQKYGNNGFAVFVKLKSELANTDFHYLNLSDEITLMYLAGKFNVSEEILLSVVNDLQKLGNLHPILWKDYKVIWWQDLTDSIQDAYKKRKNECITLQGLVTFLKGLGVLKQSLRILDYSINTQRKEKKRKEDKTKLKKTKEKGEIYIPTLEEFLEYLKTKVSKEKYAQISENAKLKFESWKENDWQTAGDNPRQIKNWKTTLLNTIPFLKHTDTSKEKVSSNNRPKN